MVIAATSNRSLHTLTRPVILPVLIRGDSSDRMCGGLFQLQSGLLG
jgi:hypothetical protein